MGFTDSNVPGQSGRCFIVTGANTGIGLEVARVLAARGARVLLGCRDAGRAAGAMADIRAAQPDADVAHLPLDLGDLDSIRRAADIAGAEPRVDVLVNNAGVMFPPLTRTAQGFEQQWGVNHLGGFALSALLLPKLAEGGDPRIVVTSSLAHRGGAIRWDDLNAERHYSRTARYSDSKLANMLHFAELDRRLRAAGSPVRAIGCHPGVAATELMRHSGMFRVFTPLFGMLLNSARAGAFPALQAATDPQAQGGDFYGPQGWAQTRGPSGKVNRTADAANQELAGRLWDVSIEMTGIDPGI